VIRLKRGVLNMRSDRFAVSKFAAFLLILLISIERLRMNEISAFGEWRGFSRSTDSETAWCREIPAVVLLVTFRESFPTEAVSGIPTMPPAMK
jgi:hypothetical protein